jgi:hypothetical protein
MTLASRTPEIRRWYRFVSTFEAVGWDSERRRQYRHRKTGALMISKPGCHVFLLRGRVPRGQPFAQ